MKIAYGKIIKQFDPLLAEQYKKIYQKFYRLNKSLDEDINPGRSAFLALTRPDSLYAKAISDNSDLTFKQKYTNSALKNFIAKHSNEKVEGKTFLQHMEDYNNGKINEKDLDRLIKTIKKSPKYILVGS